jgi:predicted dehydrogenase
MANGGPIIDSGVHFFDAVRLFTGSEFVNIEAKGVFQQPEEHPKHVIATCKMADGSIALVEAGWLHTKNTKEMDAIYHLELVGERGSVRADLTTGAFTVFTEQGTEVRKSGDGGKDFDWVYERFAASIDAGRVVGLASGVDGIKATNAAFAALASAHEDRTRDGGLAGSGVKEGRISTSAAAL